MRGVNPPGDAVDGRQSRLMSAVEAFTNVVVGYLVAVTANWLVLPLFGFAVSMVDSAAIGLVFSAIAVIRGFVLRRLFEAIRMRGTRTATAGHEGPAARDVGSADQAASMTR